MRLASWEAYGEALREFILETAAPGSARRPGASWPHARRSWPTTRVVPRLADGIRGQEFNMGRYGPAQDYFREHPGVLTEVGLSNAQTQPDPELDQWKRSGF